VDLWGYRGRMRVDEELLQRLEESLWREETRFDRGFLDRVLAPGFIEFGSSGRSHTRDQILDSPGGPIDATLPLPDFEVRWLTPSVALVTYTSEVGTGPVQRSHRSSLWRRGDEGWRIEFHQGTPFDRLADDEFP